jgi:HAD superfamily hydrolase (TIGR01509 family)
MRKIIAIHLDKTYKSKKRLTFMKEDRKYKAIIFDLDGTLIDSMPYHVAAFKDLLREHNIKIKKGELEKIIGMPTTKIFEILKKRHKFKEKIVDLREERRYHFFKFLGTQNIAFPGVMNTIKKLKKKYKVAVATGSSRITFVHSTTLDFQKLFKEVITFDDVKSGKPSPDQLLLVARKLKIKPIDCIMVGDSIFDQLAAKNAGMDSIGVLTGNTSKKDLLNAGAKFVIESVNELNKVI